jgi:hypothetical protein
MKEQVEERKRITGRSIKYQSQYQFSAGNSGDCDVESSRTKIPLIRQLFKG